MRRKTVTAVAVLAVAAMSWATSAWADGGQSIASAPTITLGQQQFGNTATGASVPYGCGPEYRSFWLLPAIAGDQVTIDWESAAPATELFVAPVGTTDFTIGESNNLVHSGLMSNDKSRSQFTAPTTGSMPLWFRLCEENAAKPGPYAFTVTDQHALALALSPRLHIRSKAVLSATADLLSGTPVPDGLSFTLTARWRGGGSKQFTAASSAGRLRFAVTLPPEVEGQHVAFRVSRPADTQFLAAKSETLSVKVARSPRKTRRLVCGKGFQKRTVHGKQRCVKFEQRQRNWPASFDSALSDVSTYSKKPTYGGPPQLGTWKLLGAGAQLTVQRDGSSYKVTGIKLRLGGPDDCGSYRGQLATIQGSFTLTRHIEHMEEENEVIYELSGVKSFGKTGHGNANAMTNGQAVPASLEMAFVPFPPPSPPLIGAINLGEVDGTECIVTFNGHPLRGH